MSWTRYPLISPCSCSRVVFLDKIREGGVKNGTLEGGVKNGTLCAETKTVQSRKFYV